MRLDIPADYPHRPQLKGQFFDIRQQKLLCDILKDWEIPGKKVGKALALGELELGWGAMDRVRQIKSYRDFEQREREKASAALPRPPTLDELGLDGRQLRLLGRVIREYADQSQEPDMQERAHHYRNLDAVPDPAVPATTRDFWELLPDEHKLLILPIFYEQDREQAPKYRAIGQRFQKIRKDRDLSVAEFAKQLCSPLGADPFPERDIQFKPNRVRDLEFGSLKFGEEIAAIVFNRFGVSGEWLLEGRGSPHTRTDTLTMPRIVSLEERVTKLEDHTNETVGVEFMKALHEQNSNLIAENPDGSLRLLGGANAKLRLDLTQTMELVEQLKARLDVQQALIAAYKKELERLEGDK